MQKHSNDSMRTNTSESNTVFSYASEFDGVNSGLRKFSYDHWKAVGISVLAFDGVYLGWIVISALLGNEALAIALVCGIPILSYFSIILTVPFFKQFISMEKRKTIRTVTKKVMTILTIGGMAMLLSIFVWLAGSSMYESYKNDQIDKYFKQGNYQEAFKICDGFDAKDKASLYYMGYMYEHGLGTSQNEVKAVECYRESAQDTSHYVRKSKYERVRRRNPGNENAKKALKKMYLENRGIPDKGHDRFRWFEEAVEAGNTSIETLFVEMYLRGEGRPRDRDAARYFGRTREILQKVQHE